MEPSTVNVPIIEETDTGVIESVVTISAEIFHAMQVFCFFNPGIKPS